MDVYFLTVKAVRRTSDKKQGVCSSVVAAITPLSSETFHELISWIFARRERKYPKEATRRFADAPPGGQSGYHHAESLIQTSEDLH